jgi:hypothetical protein
MQLDNAVTMPRIHSAKKKSTSRDDTLSEIDDNVTTRKSRKTSIPAAASAKISSVMMQKLTNVDLGKQAKLSPSPSPSTPPRSRPTSRNRRNSTLYKSFDFKLPNSLKGLNRFFNHKFKASESIIKKTKDAKTQTTELRESFMQVPRKPITQTPTTGLYKAYKKHLIETMKEPDYFESDLNKQQLEKLKHIVRGKSAIKRNSDLDI